MTPYTKLKLHLERHAYKRGQFKGEAPADASKRYKNHFRVVRGNGGQMCVRMYNTDLITVTEDNHITLNMNGWHTSTTKANMNEALHHFIGWGGVGSVRLGGYSQLAVQAKGKRYRYYDGMTFDAEGNPTCELKTFSKYRTDRDATAEFRKDMAESGFKEVWPVLFSMAEPKKQWGMYAGHVAKLVTREHHANSWADIASHLKTMFDDHREAFSFITRTCTASMKEICVTDITVL